ncbi:MAG: hypothetical protein ACK5JI_07075 [Azonexus sp.]
MKRGSYTATRIVAQARMAACVIADRDDVRTQLYGVRGDYFFADPLTPCGLFTPILHGFGRRVEVIALMEFRVNGHLVPSGVYDPSGAYCTFGSAPRRGHPIMLAVDPEDTLALAQVSGVTAIATLTLENTLQIGLQLAGLFPDCRLLVASPRGGPDGATLEAIAAQLEARQGNVGFLSGPVRLQ